MFTRIRPLVQPRPVPCSYNKRRCLTADARESRGANRHAVKRCTNCAAETAGKPSTFFISAQGKMHGLSLLQGPWRSRNSELTKNVISDWRLWACASRVLVFLATRYSFLVWHSAELKSGIWKTEKILIPIKSTIHNYYLTFLFTDFRGNNVLVYTHLSTVLVICLPAFFRYFPWLTHILFSLSTCDLNSWTFESEESSRLMFCTQQLLCHLIRV